MIRLAFGLSVLAVALSAGAVGAQQPPWAGGPPPIGNLFGYSPLTHSIDPFPSKTSPYYQSMFHPVLGGKRVYPSLVTDPRPTATRQTPVVTAPEAPVTMVAPGGPAVIAGPVQTVAPARGLRRFGRW